MSKVPELDQLNEKYEIIGELAGRADARTFIARTRDNGADVLIALFANPAGDEGNALTHLASDANRLEQSSHRNLVRVLDAQWVGNDDALAVVMERVQFPTLADLLISRKEEFSCPRVANVLRDINATLEWAREQKLVHRAVAPDAVFVEPGSDRVLLSFALRPLPLADMPGPEEDARTIATLARAMLTRSVADPERDSKPLGELRPGLADRLIEQTDLLLNRGPADGAPLPDVSEYIATVAMSDPLKKGETECANTIAKMLEEERVAREKLEAERDAAERAAAEQAQQFQNERDAFAREREKMLREIQNDRETMARERATFAKEKEEHTRDHAALVAQRQEHEQWAQEFEKAATARVAAVEKAAKARIAAVETAARERIASVEKAANARVAAAESDAADREAAKRAAAQREAEEREIAARQEAALKAAALPGVALPAKPKAKPVRAEWRRSVTRTRDRVWDRRPHWKLQWQRRWNVPAAIAGGLLLLAGASVAIARSRGDDSADARPVAQTVARPDSGSRIDSAAGTVAPRRGPASSSSAPGIPADFIQAVSGRTERAAGVPGDLISGVAARASGGEAARSEIPAYRPATTETPYQAPREVPVTPPTRYEPPPAPSRIDRPADSSFAQPAPVRPDTFSAFRRQSETTVVRPDSARRELFNRLDSMWNRRRDTTVRRDTLRP